MEENLEAVQAHMRGTLPSKFKPLCWPIMTDMLQTMMQIETAQTRLDLMVKTTRETTEEFFSMEALIAAIPAGNTEVANYKTPHVRTPYASDEQSQVNSSTHVAESMQSEHLALALEDLRRFKSYVSQEDKHAIASWVVRTYYDEFRDEYDLRRKNKIANTWESDTLSDSEYERMKAAMTAAGITTGLGSVVTQAIMQYSKRNFLSLRGLRNS